MYVPALVIALLVLVAVVVLQHVELRGTRAELQQWQVVAERRGNSGPVVGRHALPDTYRARRVRL